MTRTTTPPAAAAATPADPGTASERLQRFLDPGVADFLGCPNNSGVVSALGAVGGVPVVAYATDAAYQGGAMGKAGCRRIVDAVEAGLRLRRPVIGLWHSGGARLAEGVEALDSVGRVFAAMVRASGRIPQISVVLGPAAGGAAYGPALTDLVVIAPAGRIFVTGPGVVRSVTGERVDAHELGGPDTHALRSGVVHHVADGEPGALAAARRITGYLGQPGSFGPLTGRDSATDPASVLPANRRRAYDVRPLVIALLDAPATDGHGFEELQERYAPNIVIGFGRLGGRSVGVVANNPLRLGGCLDSASAEKAARFVRLCDSAGVPLVVLVDVPGYLPGIGQEWEGVVRRGAKLLHAFADAAVPRVTVVTRKAFGGAYIAMNSRALGATAVFAWPGAEIAVMNARAAVGVLHRRELAATPDDEREQLHDRLADEHERTAGGVDRALDLGVVDEVIAPATTRERLIEALAAAPRRTGRNRNIPL
ncbi:acyl-CoA carboxylase subunit beta [Pseudonocardia sp. HH130630-07]|uniref:acyl-CoA carboxylase subunit beta n=1 Tax=Pseudonocardia sp. HH130630-07 TaxID=1690815 RepID=UPI000814EC38|nr:carboxyl transferase domain-containing protein [Pseudonocardia sp. HH130630-07]ANY10834.1 propionyl-CoA carboxylase subunit beta [Pseudonocardia sp. HH130630-07]